MRSHASRSSIDRSAATPQRLESPGVRIPPPVFYILAFLTSLALQARFPLPFLSPALALGLGAALMAAGGLFIVLSILTLWRGHGTLNTNGSSAALVASGPYRISRNPMYLGLVLLYAGVACVFSVVWALLALTPLIIYTQLSIIAREERYLDSAFGDAYRAYKARVRRWL